MKIEASTCMEARAARLHKKHEYHWETRLTIAKAANCREQVCSDDLRCGVRIVGVLADLFNVHFAQAGILPLYASLKALSGGPDILF